MATKPPFPDDWSPIQKRIGAKSKRHAQETLKAGYPITYQKDNYIIREYPDGKIVRLKPAPPRKTASKKTFNLER